MSQLGITISITITISNYRYACTFQDKTNNKKFDVYRRTTNYLAFIKVSKINQE